MKKLQKWGVLDRQLTPSERWMTFAMILLVAVLAALNMFKASPAIQHIASDISMPKNMISQIMGAYSIPAVVFAYIGMWLGHLHRHVAWAEAWIQILCVNLRDSYGMRNDNVPIRDRPEHVPRGSYLRGLRLRYYRRCRT